MSVTIKCNYTLPKQPIYTIPATNANAITKKYYNHCVGEINKGVLYKAVCVKHIMPFDIYSYHLISI